MRGGHTRRWASELCTAFFAGSSAHATVYEINLSVGAGSVTGVIETNGVNGELSPSDLVDWNLLINSGASSFNLFGPLSGNNSQALTPKSRRKFW
jgi:hypothetical protein